MVVPAVLAVFTLVAPACRYEPLRPGIPAGRGATPASSTGSTRPTARPWPPSRARRPSEACACDVQCADRDLRRAGSAARGRPAAPCAPLGIVCQIAPQCASGFCADGVCCNVACTGACVACNRPDQMGQCVAHPGRRRGPARRLPQGSTRELRPDRLLQRRGRLRPLPGRAPCAARHPARARSSFVAASLCDGEGTCVTGGPVACAPSTCEGGSLPGQLHRRRHLRGPRQAAPPAPAGPRASARTAPSSETAPPASASTGSAATAPAARPAPSARAPTQRGRCLPGKAGLLDQRAARGEKDPARSAPTKARPAAGATAAATARAAARATPTAPSAATPRCDGAANRETPAADLRRRRLPSARAAQLRARTRAAAAVAAGPAAAATASARPATSAWRATAASGPTAPCAPGAGDCASDICAQGRCCAAACSGTCRSCALAGPGGDLRQRGGRRRRSQRHLPGRRLLERLRRRRRLPARGAGHGLRPPPSAAAATA